MAPSIPIAEKIENYFIQMEWPFDRVDESLWHTSFPGDIQVHEVFLSTDEDNWLCFRSPVAHAPAPDRQAALHQHLLRLNSLVPLTKFGVTDMGDVYALIDLPTADLDFSEFRTALQTLVNHVDSYDNEIFKILQDPAHTSSLARG